LLGEKWDKYGIYEKIFNHSKDELQRLDRVYFFYNGYHWKVGTTAGVWIYESTGPKLNYTGSLKGDDTLFEMAKAGYGFDVRRYASDPKQDTKCASTSKSGMAPAKQFANGHGYWVIRVATGKQLDKNYEPYRDMGKVWDTFTFNITGREFPYRYGAKAPTYTDKELAEIEEDENEVYE
jgi:hypothetical protein